jgi:hypothetical protein
MFRIECFVEDAKLAKVMWLLQGHVYFQSPPTPVVNAKKANGTVKPRMASGGIPDLFADYVRKHKMAEVRCDDIRTFATELGYADKSYSYVLTKLQTSGLLKKIPNDNPLKVSYRVLAKAKKAPKKAAKPEATTGAA